MSDGFLMMMLQSLAALAAVLALFAAIVWLVRHRLQGSGFQPQGERIKVVQRLALDTKHSLVEVVCGQKHYLLGLSPSGITPIAQNTEQTNDNPMQPVDT